MAARLLSGDCVEAMAAMGAASVDAVVCDPPYGIGFMGHEWDQPYRQHLAMNLGVAGRWASGRETMSDIAFEYGAVSWDELDSLPPGGEPLYDERG